MADLWESDGFGGEAAASSSLDSADDDWDEGEESLETSLEDGFDDPDEPEGDAWDDDDDG